MAGSTPHRVYGNVINDNNGAAYNARQQGVFGAHPLMTPKYARNAEPAPGTAVGARDAEFKDTLARMYIALPDTGDPSRDKEIRNAYVKSLPKEAQPLANVLLASEGGTGFVDFFLSSAQEAFQEIVQVDKVLSDDYVAFFYGQSPPQFQYSGYLLNSLQDDQRTGFARAYLTMLRGTQLARRRALVRLRYDSVVVSGTLLATQQTLAAENELAVPFSFSILVKDYYILSNSNSAFTKKTPREYVELASQQQDLEKLASVGSPEDLRVRATVLTPDQRAAVSAAGKEDVTYSAVNAVVGAGPTGAAVGAPLATAGSAVSSTVKNILGVFERTPKKPLSPPDNATPPVIKNGKRVDKNTGQEI